MAKLVLVGLVEPTSEEAAPAFEEWYLGNHIEDTANCPVIRRGTVFKLARPFADTSPPQYLTIYEIEGDDAVAAERELARYQGDPNAWPERLPSNGSLKIVGAGWYEQDRQFDNRQLT